MTRQLLFVLLFGLLTSGCGGGGGTSESGENIPHKLGTVPSDGVYRILALGDSITEGEAPNVTYRYWLHHLFLEAGIPVDFVGPRYSVHGGSPRLTDYDQDHLGIPGADITVMGAVVYEQVGTINPDIILIHAGTNDLLHHHESSTAAGDLRHLILTARLLNPTAYIFVAQIIPTHRKPAEVAAYNALLPALAAELSTEASPVIVVDQYTGFSLGSDSYDGVHPTESGEKKIALRWFDAVMNSYFAAN